jgi:hypothetical protein
MFIARLLRPVETKHTETPLTRATVLPPYAGLVRRKTAVAGLAIHPGYRPNPVKRLFACANKIVDTSA